MKNLFYIIAFIFSMVFWACTDGQERMHQSPQEILLENKLLDSFSEKAIRFIPEAYVEKTIDTTLSNGKKIVIKTFTDMENGVLKESNANSFFYRDLKASVLIKNNDTSIELTIDKALIKDKDLYCEDLKEFYNERIIKSISLSEYDSLELDKTVLLIDLCEPQTSFCIQFNLIIENSGDLKLIETKKQ